MPDKKPTPGVRSAARQEQFLEVITRDEATDRFRRHLVLAPLGRETVPLGGALHRVLASTVASTATSTSAAAAAEAAASATSGSRWAGVG